MSSKKEYRLLIYLLIYFLWVRCVLLVQRRVYFLVFQEVKNNHKTKSLIFHAHLSVLSCSSYERLLFGVAYKIQQNKIKKKLIGIIAVSNDNNK